MKYNHGGSDLLAKFGLYIQYLLNHAMFIAGFKRNLESEMLQFGCFLGSLNLVTSHAVHCLNQKTKEFISGYN